MASPTPYPVAPIENLVDNLGTQVLNLAVGLAPVAVPFVLALAAIGYVLNKFGLGERIELRNLERAAAVRESAARERAHAREQRRARKWDAMVADAYAENRRRDLRAKFSRKKGGSE